MNETVSHIVNADSLTKYKETKVVSESNKENTVNK